MSLPVAIACPGPSLGCMPGRDHFQLVIGVNRAPCKRVCDWAALMDAKTWYEVCRSGGYLGSPGILRPRFLAAILSRCPQPLPKGGLSWLEISHRVQMPRRSYTINNAIQAAVALGEDVRDVWVFGADWDGTRDYDGTQVSGDRSEARWAAEKQIYEQVVADMDLRGVRVTRRLL